MGPQRPLGENAPALALSICESLHGIPRTAGGRPALSSHCAATRQGAPWDVGEEKWQFRPIPAVTGTVAGIRGRRRHTCLPGRRWCCCSARLVGQGEARARFSWCSHHCKRKNDKRKRSGRRFTDKKFRFILGAVWIECMCPLVFIC